MGINDIAQVVQFFSQNYQIPEEISRSVTPVSIERIVWGLIPSNSNEINSDFIL